MRVQVCIPHYFKEHADPGDNPNGYGSLRSGARLARSIALSRCISELLNIQKNKTTLILNHHNRRIDKKTCQENKLEVEINICTDGKNFLEDVLDLYQGRINHVKMQLKNPRELPLYTRDFLIQNNKKFNLYTYIEDDIIVHDEEFFNKQIWFLEKTNSQLILMPHRYERVDTEADDVLIVDGTLRPGLVNLFQPTEKRAGSGKYLGNQFVEFDIADNPHSGTFTISNSQREMLSKFELPKDGFIGPLETAATLTVLKYFKVFKPNIEH